MHIAAMNPTVVRGDEVSDEELARHREIFKAQAVDSGKPEHIAEKMVEGRLKKWLKSVSLVEQPFVKNPDKTVGELEVELTAKIGEKVKIRRFIRFEVGEGMEKRNEDFAAEVAKQAGLG